MMKTIYGAAASVDILAIGVHPDDIELSCSATIMKHIDMGVRVGLVDLTEGELGSRGNAAIRLEESREAASYMGVQFRLNVGMADGFFQVDRQNTLSIIEVLRLSRPKIILANSLSDRHPDHGRAARLVADAFFYSGLSRIITNHNAFRADVLYHYIQDKNLKPDFCVDVTGYEDRKRQAIECFKTQFYVPDLDQTDEAQTPISSASFKAFLFAKMQTFGRSIGVEFAEGFNINRTLGINDMRSLV